MLHTKPENLEFSQISPDIPSQQATKITRVSHDGMGMKHFSSQVFNIGLSFYTKK